MPDWVAILAEQKRNLPSLTTLVVLLIVIAASIVFVHPQVPESWTGEVHGYSFQAWALMIGGAVMLANRFLLEQASVALAAVNLWGRWASPSVAALLPSRTYGSTSTR